ncbi:MAG: hypothetical protein KF696_09745 [Planctomycetes bacterium]|nr:hypothetical protein [Planctomycetota bacterium]MCW8136139.1 hypothetical protein [Planctomycetota bacterium]
MKRLVDNLPWIFMAVTAVVFLGYNFWWKERPQAGGLITGDFVQASEAAAQRGVPLLLAVDNSPN